MLLNHSSSIFNNQSMSIIVIIILILLKSAGSMRYLNLTYNNNNSYNNNINYHHILMFRISYSRLKIRVLKRESKISKGNYSLKSCSNNSNIMSSRSSVEYIKNTRRYEKKED